MTIILTLSILFIAQITLFYFYRISSLITGIIFALMFGEFSLKLVSLDAMPIALIDITIFMILFYLSLMKLNGEFFKKYIWKYKASLILPTILTMVAVFITALAIELDTHIAFIMILVLGVISLSTNSITVDFLKSYNLEKSEIYKLFFAKALPNNVLIVTLFVTLLAIFDTGSTSILDISMVFGTVIGFIILSIAISRYVYPRVAQKFKNSNIILALLLFNALLQSCIADFMGLNFIIGVFLSTLFIPEKFLKITVIEPIRTKVGNINNYIFVPIFGLAIGLNIDISIIFDYDLFIPFAILTITILIAQTIFGVIFFRYIGLAKKERTISLFGSFSKTELSLIILLMSVSYGLIDGDIFTSSIILISVLNILTWYSLKSINMEKN